MMRLVGLCSLLALLAASAAWGAEPTKPATKLPAKTKVPAKAASSKLPELLQKVEKKYSESKTLQAKFEQVNHSVVTGMDKKSSGTIAFKRPGKVRWETLLPLQSKLVSDGKTFWFYTPPMDPSENGQVIEKKSTEVQSRIAQSLLSGAFSAARDVKIETTSPSQFMLNFKKGTAGTVESARLEIDPDQLLIRKVTLHNTDGNTSEISLSDIELGKLMEDSSFVFVAPPRTDKISP